MFKNILSLGALLSVAALVAGCAGAQNKLGRGVNNSLEPIRLAEWRRSVQQTELYDISGNANFHTGMVRGFSRTMARTGVGIYEILTFPIPTYDPIFTDYLSPLPQYPDGVKPALPEAPIFGSDESLGFSGGTIGAFIPGGTFEVFDN
jgi:putative exosortase-associated protein (TIGR04073 family)